MNHEDKDLIARVLRTERDSHEGFPAQVMAIDNVAKAFAHVLRTGDIHFSSTAFLAQCGFNRESTR
jgi:hypothetical protein